MATLALHCAVAVLLVVFGVSGVVRGLDEQHSYKEGNYGTAGLVRDWLDDSRPSWDYTNLKKWPRLCQTGSRQSPISFANVNPDEVVTTVPLQRLQLSPKCLFPREETQMRIVNEGAVNTVSFERQGLLPEDLSECTVRDPLNSTRIFYFTGLHFHAASEHKFRTLRPDVEMHLSFTTDEVKEKKRDLLMVAVMLKASATVNSTSVRALRHILVDGSLPKRHAMTTCFLTENLSITSLLPPRESYLLYDGSRTHPPCTENVRWVVMTSPILISRVAVGKLRDSMDELLPNDFHRYGNARPPQALNGRRIFRFDDASVPVGGDRKDGTLDDTWSRKGRGAANSTPAEAQMAAPTRVLVDSTEELNGRLYGSDVVHNSPVFMAESSSALDEDTRDDANATATTSPPPPATAAASDTAAPSAPPVSDPNTTRHTGSANASDGATDSVSTTAPKASLTPSASEAANEEAAQAGSGPSDTDASPTEESSPTSAAPVPVSPKNSTPRHPANVSTTNTTNTTTTTTTTTAPTKTKPPDGKGKGGRGDKEGERMEFDTNGTWARLTAFGTGAYRSGATYAKMHPVRAVLVLISGAALILLIFTCCRGWKRPVYVVGIDPTELQPLNAANRFDLYGGTGTPAVRPAYAATA
ncbi:carbonic anhydrase-like protein [Novymonas esmeraldas]|uniref:carbonic anhydrase n=1 Tax=Novymonas esmeraldas TaxID=1808958 RepID=A0AAW0F7D8_9TRYP